MGKHKDKPEKRLQARRDKYDSAKDHDKQAGTRPGSLKK